MEWHTSQLTPAWATGVSPSVLCSANPMVSSTVTVVSPERKPGTEWQRVQNWPPCPPKSSAILSATEWNTGSVIA